jgi:hypothetical protein
MKHLNFLKNKEKLLLQKQEYRKITQRNIKPKLKSTMKKQN